MADNLRGLPATVWDETRARTIAATAGRAFPAADADDVWGWTDDADEAEGIIESSDGECAGVDPATASGGATVYVMSDVITFAAE